MDGVVSTHLSAWENFYLITGPSAAALTGLQFVVIALVADMGATSTVSVSAFGTPTILHFCIVLLLSGVLTAPWMTSGAPAVAIGVAGIIGLLYMLLSAKRSRSQSVYTPVLEDWIWYLIVPSVTYAALIVAAAVLPGHERPALFIVGAVVLVLLFLGIRNAWDSVVYIVIARRERRAETTGENTNV